VAELRLNPFALSVTVRGFQVKDPDGSPFVAFDRLYVNYDLLALLAGARFARDELGVEMPAGGPACEFSDRNRQCLEEECPFHREGPDRGGVDGRAVQ
jgi:hypothetical protein